MRRGDGLESHEVAVEDIVLQLVNCLFAYNVLLMIYLTFAFNPII